ncbi:methyltransferase family protein [Salipaludibacillus daqingensis]|uniref:methyltransferase family protein n=1 Tax=Salipaludibacillus daqingensis TaxID=3041001 RepID=UPI0024752010|nr:isoprenylcysteine carboxylmethyltransferase family protein [Salipaludibacillus daqingensis]
MAIVDILFITITIIWIGEFFVFKNRRVDDDKSEDTSSFSPILFSTIGVITVSIFSREFSFLSYTNTSFMWIGVLFYSFGVFIRYWGMVKLGKQFTRNVNVATDDQIVGTGPFRFLRHPLYSGLLSTLIGISIYTGSIIGFLMIFIVFIPFLLKRIRLEEAMLTKAFGPDYKKWAKTRKRLVPFLY